METCNLCKTQFKNVNGLAKHIHNQHKDWNKEQYYISFIKETSKKCNVIDCNNPSEFRDLGRGFLNYCSQECCKKDPTHREKISKAASKRVYTQETIDKRRNTLMEKYGVACGYLLGKNVPELYKGFCCRSSYEKLFVDFAEKYGYTLKVPNRISYEFEGRKRWYFPDFEIVELCRVVEIKSKWTYNLNKDLNKVKIEFTKAQDIDIIIVDETHGLLDNHEKLNEYICSR